MLHADAMPQLRTKRLYRADVSQTHKDLTNDKYRDMRRPKKVTFFNNGDKFSKGKKLFITPHRYLSFQDLLGDLTNKLPSTSSLPYGVRQIYTPRGGRRIRDIEHLQDGQEYVCAGFESFKAMNYGTQALDPWSTGRPHRHTDNPSTIDLKGVSALPHPSSINQGLTPRHHFEAYPQRKPLRPLNDPYSLREDDRRYGAITKPKVITVVRAGRKPYANIKILLNRRSVQSYERLLNDISESFGPKWKNNKVRSLYTLTGREVLSISDFFRGDSIFVAVGNEKISFTDVQDIIETLYPDSTYAKTLLRNIEKQKRKAKQQMLQSLANDNQELLEKQGSEKPPPPAPSKKVVKRLPVEETSAEDAAETESNQKKTLPSKPGKRPAADSPRDEENEEKPKQSEKEPDATEDIEKPRPKKKIAKKVLQPKPTENAQPEKEEKATAEQEPDTPIEQVKDKTKKVQAQANSKRQLKEERQKEQERLLQEKRDAEAKAKAELYRNINQKVIEEAAEKDTNEEKEKEPIENAEKEKEPIENAEPKMEEKPKEEEKLKMKLAKSKEERLVDLDEIKTQFDIGRVLGDGNFAVVNACQHRDTGHEYAMKIIDKSKLRGKEHMIDNEIAIMKACHQENLVKLYEEFETREEIYLVMEYVKGGDLFDAIKNSVRFTEPVASKMSADMTNALFYLHSRGIVHRDVKPENLMVMRNKDNSMTLKLGDFGLAVEVKAPIFTICGTPTYVAPEILSEIGYGLEVDMWAVGIITYILLCGFPPFRATDNKQTELFEYIKAGEYEFLSPYWDAVSAEAIDLIRHLLVVDKRSRYTAVEVLCHPWIITVGGSKELPDLFPQYQEKYREVIIAQGKANYAEWKEHRGRIFANSNHNTSLTKL